MPRVAEEDEGSREEVSFDFFLFSVFFIPGCARPASHPLPGPLPSLPDCRADQEEAHHLQPCPQVHLHPPLLHRPYEDNFDNRDNQLQIDENPTVRTTMCRVFNGW